MSADIEARAWAALTSQLTELLDERGDEPGDLARATLLYADLGVSSVETIHLLIMIEDALGIALSFEKLAVRDGEYVEELSLGEMHDFLSASLGEVQGAA